VVAGVSTDAVHRATGGGGEAALGATGSGGKDADREPAVGSAVEAIA
jgi:hypothetical protein